MRYARLLKPYKGYRDIQVDEDSINGGYHGYQYRCIVVGSGAEIYCSEDEFELEEQKQDICDGYIVYAKYHNWGKKRTPAPVIKTCAGV